MLIKNFKSFTFALPFTLPFALSFVCSIAALCVVWGYQFFAKVVPCHLCLLERLPLYAYLAAFVAYVLAKKFYNKKWLDFYLNAIALTLFTTGACIAFYHILVVQEVVSSSCGLDFNEIALSLTQNTPSLASCTDTSFAILGVPAVYLCFAFFTFFSLYFCFFAAKSFKVKQI